MPFTARRGLKLAEAEGLERLFRAIATEFGSTSRKGGYDARVSRVPLPPASQTPPADESTSSVVCQAGPGALNRPRVCEMIPVCSAGARRVDAEGSQFVLLVSEIELPDEADAAAFADFMRDEYIPAVRKGPTRVGQVVGVELVRRATSETTQTFLWLVRWSGLSGGRAIVDDEAVRRRFEELGAAIKDPVEWQEVAKWPEPGLDR